MKTTCPICQKPFGKRKRCYWCNGPKKRTGEQSPCPTCGRSVYRQKHMATKGRNEGTYCSVPCKVTAMTGRLLVSGTRYIRKADGYVMVKTGVRKWELEHRLKMSKKLRRPLTTNEHVHHRNGNKQDNRLVNLQLLTNSEHWAMHHQKK